MTFHLGSKGSAVVQWNHACFGVRGVSKRTGSNSVHGPSIQSKRNGAAGGRALEGGELMEKKDKKASSARFTIYKVNKASKKKREKSSAKKERKATKTLAIVLGKDLFSLVRGSTFIKR
ncbi:Dopamine D2-like receptor [Portunus trituberculatus]|uniref:Dopamine D2-like receptor n=1 Tax=Portunus trituberculatus TaxID=210409 RepID=A0A5B7E7I7_PORTR|nr:Dopamine D2-like receptor [Portunus trituberculatus]